MTDSLDPAVVYPDTGDVVADLRAQLTAIIELISTTDFGPAYLGLLAAGQSDPNLLRDVFDQIIDPNIKAFGARMARARERGELRTDADVGALRDLLYGVIEYRFIHAMPIERGYIDAVLSITFQGVR